MYLLDSGHQLAIHIDVLDFLRFIALIRYNNRLCLRPCGIQLEHQSILPHAHIPHTFVREFPLFNPEVIIDYRLQVEV